MFVLQWTIPRSLGRYIRRNASPQPGYARLTCQTVRTLDEATKFQSFDEITTWIGDRLKSEYTGFPTGVQLVEVRSVPQPQYEVVKVIG